MLLLNANSPNLSLSLILSFGVKDPLNETAEGPTVWSFTTLNGEQELDRTETQLKGSSGKQRVYQHSDGVSALKMNRTVVNSTFNYNTTQEVRTFYHKVCQL